jgi:phytoene dehydrogenase-like protein
MSATYDAIVVGGGHNGLVAAAYLARSGASTVVLEGRGKTGGAATTEAPWPDAPEYKVTRLSYVMSLMPPTIISELDLARHGYKIYPMGPYYQAFPEGGSIRLYADDAKRNHEEVSKWSKKDADAMPRWDAWLAGLADVLGPLLLTVPPAIGSHRPRDLAGTLRLAWRHRGLDVRTIADVTRLMTMSIADLLDDWFDSPQVKGALAVNGVIGTWAGPYSPGTAYVMAHHSIGDVGDGHLGNWGFQEGGMGGVSAAIEAAARAHGAQIRTGARVARLIIEGDRAVGVVLDDGEELRAQVIVSTLHPRTAFLEQVGAEYLPDAFVSDIEHWKTRSGVVKINLALAELPDFTADPGSQLQEHHTGSVEMAPSMEYMERAFQDARDGRPAQFPFSDGVIPTTFDTKLCPEGSHIMSLFTQWVPADWSEEPHTGELEAYADRMIDCYNELAPNFKASILHRDIVGPYQMEQEYGLVGGNIFHGELSLEQLFHMRPAPGYADYRTPLTGLYYGSSATHGGGGVCGIPGWQAARAAIADKKAERRSGQLRRLTRRP